MKMRHGRPHDDRMASNHDDLHEAMRRDTWASIVIVLTMLLVLGLGALAAFGQTFPAPAGQLCPTVSPMLSPTTSFASATSTATAAALPSIPTNAVMAVITITTPTANGGIIYRDDGGTPLLFATPSTGVGTPASVATVNSQTTMIVCQPQLSRFRFISGAGGAAILNIMYYTR